MSAISYLRRSLETVPWVRSGIKKALSIIRSEVPTVSGTFNLAELPELLGKTDPVILEIGCNDGSHTLEFLKLFRNPQIYAFEPDPRARERFRRNVTDERVKLFDLAISDIDGVTEFHLSDGLPPSGWSGHSSSEWQEMLPNGWDASGSLRKPAKHLQTTPWCKFDSTIAVRTRRLDTWCTEEKVDLIDFVWADVQGAEANLIEGAKAALKRTRYFYTEYSNQELYEGQINLGGILGRLPDFEVVYRFWSDALLKNKSIASGSQRNRPLYKEKGAG